MKIKLPGIDLSGLGLPKVVRQTSGFDLQDLGALFLFEDGSNGASLTTALDSSGSGRHASLVAGSTAPVKAAAGAHKEPSTGSFLYSIPGITFGQKFSFVIAARCLVTLGTTNAFPSLWRPLASVDGGSLVNSQTGGEAINMNHQSAVNVGQRSWFHPSGYMKPVGGAVGDLAYQVDYPGVPKTDWMAIGFSYNPDTDTYVLANANTFGTIVAPIPSAITKARGSLHTFGLCRYAAVANIPGDVGLCAMYTEAFSGSRLQQIIAQAKRRMAQRGVTVS